MSDDRSADVLLMARTHLRTIEEKIVALRRGLGRVLPVVVSSSPQVPAALEEALGAREALEEALAEALARLREARAHLAVAQPALAEYERVRAANHQKLLDLAAERRAESGGKPS